MEATGHGPPDTSRPAIAAETAAATHYASSEFVFFGFTTLVLIPLDTSYFSLASGPSSGVAASQQQPVGGVRCCRTAGEQTF